MEKLAREKENELKKQQEIELKKQQEIELKKQNEEVKKKKELEKIQEKKMKEAKQAEKLEKEKKKKAEKEEKEKEKMELKRKRDEKKKKQDLSNSKIIDCDDEEIEFKNINKNKQSNRISSIHDSSDLNDLGFQPVIVEKKPKRERSYEEKEFISKLNELVGHCEEWKDMFTLLEIKGRKDPEVKSRKKKLMDLYDM